ncbi:hypothetical protein PR048_027450 [Dryococelus australis]|uniref:Uncharacterized protein n=1 Tax=Dryococelus australis TaxID=614101 RepID=A0ABQ9GFI4_9NEOP|nr:hypothetical protein PR048_027450 [Dryococelus australis]
MPKMRYTPCHPKMPWTHIATDIMGPCPNNGAPVYRHKLDKIMRDWGPESSTTPAYLPQANPTEHKNQELKKSICIRMGNNHTQWEAQLPEILYTLR